MRHGVNKVKLNLGRDRRRLLLRNLATSLLMHEKIQTTQARAKALQPFVEKIIHSAKKENKILAIREVNRHISSELSAKKLVNELSKKYQERPSGYTRITKIGFRAGDAAPLVQIELV